MKEIPMDNQADIPRLYLLDREQWNLLKFIFTPA